MNNIGDGDSNGVSFICNDRGVIRRVLFDSAGLFTSRESPSGDMVTQYFDRESSTKVISFIKEVQQNGGSFNHEFKCKGEENHRIWLFSGLRLDNDELLLSGSPPSQDYEKFVEELLRMNNENINELRRLVKLKTRGEGEVYDEGLYDELSRLNNELTNTQRQLIKKTVELEKINEQKNRALGMAAHDLRNPLSVIQNFSQFLIEEHEEKPYLGDQQKTLVVEIFNSTRLMLAIIEDMLDFSSIETGNVRLRKESVNLNRLVDRVVSLQRQQAEKKKILLETIHTKEPTICEADPGKIEQVMNNLIINAIKFSDPGTATRVYVKRVSDSAVEIEVKDEGQGIPENELSNLFVPFAKLSVKTTGGESSTGLGLAITKKIIDAHKGTISVESQVGRGSSFIVNLPA
jgi:signal transduction histidine kinase